MKEPSPVAVTLGEGHGWMLRQDRDGELRMHIAHWSAEAGQALRESGSGHIIQTGSWADGESVLRKLVDLAPQIRSLTTSAAPVSDLSCIGELVMLERLILQHRDPGIDYSRLTRLRELFLWDQATPGRVAEAPALEWLQLSKVKMPDLRALEGCGTLRTLMLMQMGSFKSLVGIERLRIESLDITYGARFGSFAPLAGLSSLGRLVIDGNSKVADIGAIGALKALEVLALDNGPALPDFDLVGTMTSLQRLDLRNTPVGTGPTSATPLTRLKHLRSIFLLGRPRSYKNLTDLERLGEIASLESLTLDNIADLHSIAWLRGLQRLRLLRVGGTRLRDPHVSALLDLPELRTLDLDVRGFSRGSTKYQPSYEEVMSLVRQRGAEATTAGPKSTERSPR